MGEYAYQLNLKSIVENALQRFPDQEIVYRDRVRYTTKDFHGRIKKLAKALSDLGIKEGSKVAVLEWDTHRYLELYYAIPMMGSMLHMVNLNLPPDLIAYIINHAQDDAVIMNDEFLRLIEPVSEKLTSVKNYMIMSDGEQKETKLEHHKYEDLIKSSSDYEFSDIDENKNCALFYTTGTTGMPKGVIFSQRQLCLHAMCVALQLTAFPSPCMLSSQDVLMGLVPYFHVNSWGFPHVSLIVGPKLVMPGRYDPKLILDLIEREKVTFSHMVPSILQMVIAHPEAKDHIEALSRWKVIIGGAALPMGLAKSAEKLGIKVAAGYGLSETCPVLTISSLKNKMADWHHEKQLEYLIKTGLPIPFVKLEIVDENMNPMKHDGKDVGEIVVRAPWLTREYYKDEEKTKELWKGGWLHTGDVASIDEEGYLQITGRTKFIIKSGGEWISPLLLESVLSTHPAVKECAVIGTPSEKWGERPVAVVVPADVNVSEKELRDCFMKAVDEGKILKWWVPDRIFFTSEIPKTSVGKIDTMKLMEEYKDRA